MHCSTSLTAITCNALRYTHQLQHKSHCNNKYHCSTSITAINCNALRYTHQTATCAFQSVAACGSVLQCIHSSTLVPSWLIRVRLVHFWAVYTLFKYQASSSAETPPSSMWDHPFSVSQSVAACGSGCSVQTVEYQSLSFAATHSTTATTHGPTSSLCLVLCEIGL